MLWRDPRDVAAEQSEKKKPWWWGLLNLARLGFPPMK